MAKDDRELIVYSLSSRIYLISSDDTALIIGRSTRAPMGMIMKRSEGFSAAVLGKSSTSSSF